MKTAVREYPLPMSAAMIQALKARAKSQTRRLVRGVFRHECIDVLADGQRRWCDCIKDWDDLPSRLEMAPDNWEICPYGVPGDRLWIREAFYLDHVDYARGGPLPARRPQGSEIYYRADGECCQQIPECACAEVGKVKWRQWIHMPRWASRWLLEITETRCQRLHDIPEDDALAEGVRVAVSVDEMIVAHNLVNEGKHTMGVAVFRAIWQRLHSDEANRWDANPWVWALTFKVLEGPVSGQGSVVRGQKGINA